MIQKRVLIRSVASTSFFFSLLVWMYVVVIQVTHPGWLYGRFSHVDYFPFNQRLDEVGMAAFAVAAVGFLVWQITAREDQRARRSRG